MSGAERIGFLGRIRRHLESGKLDAEAFGDLTLLYSSLNDPSLNGARLEKYETSKGWAEIDAKVLA